MSHRNRVTYQSESVFVGDNDQPTPDLLTRVQNANYNFNITRTDVNQFGQVGRIDSLILEAPTVSLDLSYLLTDGKNEEHLDFVVINDTLGGADDVPFYKNILLGPNNGAPKRTPEGEDLGGDPMSGKSYYILTVPDGKDSISSDGNPYDPNVAGNSLIKIGNGYINEWSMEVSVGALPTVSCSFEAANCEVTNYIGADGKFGALPAVDLVAFKRLTTYEPLDNTTYVTLPTQITEDNNYNAQDQVSALRPGDIAISLSTSGDQTQPGVIAKQLVGDIGTAVEGAAHIQSFNLSIPFGRTPLQRIGTLFSFARPLDLPTNATFSVNALVSDLNDGKLMDKLCQKDLQIHIVMRAPECPNLDSPVQGGEVIEIVLKDVELESESIGSSIGDNKTVDLTFNVGIHGAEDGNRGIFVRFHDADPVV